MDLNNWLEQSNIADQKGQVPGLSCRFQRAVGYANQEGLSITGGLNEGMLLIGHHAEPSD